LPKYPTVAIIIPVFNEEAIIAKTLQKTLPYAFSIVVDNGSTDSSYQVSKKCGAHVIRESRRGYGRAILAGMLEAKRMQKEHIVILDADLSNDPNDLPTLLSPVLNNEVDLCLSMRTRKEDQKNLQPHQLFGNALATRLIYLFTGFHFNDLGPFRAFQLSKILALNMQDPTYGWNIEMQIKAVKNNLKIKEIELPYYERQAGQSKISGNLSASITAGIIILQSVVRYSR
jgi:glycosyltransferase involved in cell wall biosynthesis